MPSLINKKTEIFKIVAIYFLFGCAWIYLSDSILGWMVRDTGTLTTVSTYKGIFFIIFTSALLYLLLVRFNRKIDTTAEEHRKSDERFNFLVKNTSDILLIIDRDGRQWYVSPAAERLTGFTIKELEGKRIFEIIHPEDAQTVEDAWQEALKHPQKPITVRYRHIHRNGRWIYCEAIAQNFLDEPAVNGVIASIRDITENTLAVQALAEKDALLSAIVRNLPFDFWVRDVDQKIILQNDKSIELWGDLLSNPNNDWAFDPSTIETWKSNNKRALNGENISEECELVNINGEKRFYHNIIVPIWDRDRKLGILGINIDITDRKHAEQSLHDSEQRFFHAFQYAPIGMALASPDGKYIKVNRAFCHLTGYSKQELLAKRFQDITHPEDLKTDLAEVQKMLSGEISTFQLEKRYIHKDGHPIWILLSVSSILNEDGTVKHFVAQVLDISSRKQTEDELRKGELLMKKIFDMLPIGLWFLDKEGNVRHQNAMGWEIWASEPGVPFLGPRKIQAWRLPSLERIDEEDRASVKAFRKGITTVDELIEIESLDGKRKTVLNYATPIFDDEGKVDGAIVVNLDISDRRKLEEQLLQAQKMESVGRLAGGVAHDFNNMLSVILGNIELAMSTLSADAPVQARLNIVKDAAKRSANLTQQLLAFARQQPVSPRLLDLNATVEEMLKMLRRLIGEDIELTWIPGKNLGSVNVDPSQLDQILVNLCVNARDAIGDTGKMSITTQNVTIDQALSSVYSEIPPGQYVMLAVSDNGCGMDKGTLLHLFEPFFTTKSQGKGTGLGLATVYGIVTQNNGFIDVSSVPGKETVFKIYLPLHVPPSDASIDTVETDEPIRGNETILLVEDEPMLLDLTKMMLDKLGYNVITAMSPTEAIRLIHEIQCKIDLLITDVIMPEMNGRDLAKNISTHCPGLKVLFISGYTADVIAHHGVLDKDVHFLQKPITGKDLAAKTREALEATATLEL
ncbi:PAS domain S-box protein [Desulfopila aestuarii]|uniref:histidine kinase n=1 Tax=Desulfopila aestuarii DSM 18488 TaxID=1121416 RepID=A0A1M7YM34_9BACT|nr:PAS domain S-box protein [Desulfopila aestuarii]SHO53679.1 PAS domain S-box-containing protein [Desulfopila aestuarii DSM 18488]